MLSLLYNSSVAPLVQDSQHVIEIREDRSGTQTRVTPLRLSLEGPQSTRSRGGALWFQFVSSGQTQQLVKRKRERSSKHWLDSSPFFK